MAKSIEVQVGQLMKDMGVNDPRDAMRLRVRQLISEYCEFFGELTVPVKLNPLVSYRDIKLSDERPLYSEDAELVSDDDGVKLRLNSERPVTRQRFSIGHEISHTFFAGYAEKAQCRTDARHRNRNDPEQLIEALCDVGASEFLFPYDVFCQDAEATLVAQKIAVLPAKYLASPEATYRRYAEVSSGPTAVIFFAWKTKPTQESDISTDAPDMFGETADDRRNHLTKLRVDYHIANEPFNRMGLYVPSDKSVPCEGPIQRAAVDRRCEDGEMDLDLGSNCKGRFLVHAIPLYTSKKNVGPNGEYAVAAILRPRELKPSKKKNIETPQMLFGD